MTLEQALIQRLSDRIGALTVTVESMALRIETLRLLCQQHGIDPDNPQPEVSTNGDLERSDHAST